MSAPDPQAYAVALRAELKTRLGEEDAERVINLAVQISDAIHRDLPPVIALEVIYLLGRTAKENECRDKIAILAGKN